MADANQAAGGGSAGAVAAGAIASSVYNDNSTTTTTVTPQNTTTVGGANYAAQIGLGPNANNNNITSTTTDFGAIAAGQAVAQTALNQNGTILSDALAGQAQLNALTGQALDEATAAIAAKSTPFSQVVGKYGTYIVGIIGAVIVLGLAVVWWHRPKKREKKEGEE